jgi:hypothetical protein
MLQFDTFRTGEILQLRRPSPCAEAELVVSARVAEAVDKVAMRAVETQMQLKGPFRRDSRSLSTGRSLNSTKLLFGTGIVFHALCCD